MTMTSAAKSIGHASPQRPDVRPEYSVTKDYSDWLFDDGLSPDAAAARDADASFNKHQPALVAAFKKLIDQNA